MTDTPEQQATDNKDGRLIVPPSKLTEKPHPNLVPNKPPRAKSRWSGHQQVDYKQSTPIPEFADYLCDGSRLLIDDANSKRVNVGASMLGAFVFAIMALVNALVSVNSVNPDIVFEAKVSFVVMVFLILLGFFLLRKLSRMNQEDFYVFDRSTGNVRLPKRFRCPAYTLPFSELVLYTVEIPTQSGLQFTIFFYPKVIPKGARSVIKYEVLLGNGVTNNRSTAPYWAFLNRFMDTTQPIPDIPYIKKVIAMFEKHNKTMDDIPFDEETGVSENA